MHQADVCGGIIESFCDNHNGKNWKGIKRSEQRGIVLTYYEYHGLLLIEVGLYRCGDKRLDPQFVAPVWTSQVNTAEHQKNAGLETCS